MKIVKRIIFALLALIILLVAAIIIAPVIFKDDIIALVKDEANKNLNAKVDFGEFDLSLLISFPDFTFEINNVSVAGVDTFQNDTLMSLGKLRLTVDVMSVIKGEEISVKTILIDGLNMNAIVLKDGKANWDIAKAADTTEVAEPVAAETTDTSAAAPFKLSLKKLDIKNTNVVYDDRQGGMRAEINDFNYALKGDFTQDFTALDMEMSIKALTFIMDKVKFMNKAELAFKAAIDADVANSKYTFKENEFRINQLILAWDGWVAMPNENDIDLDIKFGTRKTEFKSILSMVPAVYTKDFQDVKTAGKLALDGYAKGTYKEKSLPTLGVNLLIENAMFKYPDLPAAVDNINIGVKITNPGGSEDNTVIDVSKFHVELAGNPVDIHLVLRTPISDPQIDCGIKGEIDLSKLKDLVPLDSGDQMSGIINSDIVLKGRMSTIEKQKYEEFDALGDLRFTNLKYSSAALPQGANIQTMHLKFSPKYVDLAAFDCIVGKSDFHANGVIENFIPFALTDSAVLKGRYTLSSTLVDVNEFMAVDSGAATTVPTGEAGAAPAVATADTTPMSVFEVPANIDFSLNSSFGKILYDKLEITDVRGGLLVADHRLTMDKLGMKLLGGSMVMTGSYDTKDAKSPAVDYDLVISDWDIPMTFAAFNTVQKLAPIMENCSGKFGTTLKFESRLNEKMEPIDKTINGGGTLKSKNIVISGSATINKLADALKQEKYKRLELKDIDATYEFREGRVWVKPFEVKMGNSKATISGSNGFDQTLDYTMRMTVPTSEFGGEAAGLLGSVAGLAGQIGLKVNVEAVDVDILIQGTVTDPKVKIGRIMPAGGGEGKGVKEQIKEEIGKQIEEVKEKVKDEAIKLAREEADKIIAEGQKQADALKAETRNLAEKVKQEGYKNASDLENKGANFLEKAANKAAAGVLRKETDKRAQQITDEGDKKAQALLDAAKKKADETVEKAK